jgi:hypothetical protein
MNMKKIILTLLIAWPAFVGPSTAARAEDAKEEGRTRPNDIMAAQKVDRVAPGQDSLLRSVEKSDRVFTRLENTELKIISYFHQRKIGEAIVEKDFIRYQFDTEARKLLEKKVQWREGLPEELPPVIASGQAEAMTEGDVRSVLLYFISPNSEIFRIRPTPKNPCWVVRSVNGDRTVFTIIDAVTGEKLGYGTPPPYGGLSIHGPDHDPPLGGGCDNDDPLWYDHAQNAHNWFETMGYDTVRIGSATQAQIQAHIQSDSTVMFYELDHGGSTSFKIRCEDDLTADEVGTMIAGYASMGLAFIGSCEGMCLSGDGRFEHEFRKGSNVDTVVVGYCGMSWDECADDCWGEAIAWQTEFFSRLNSGNTAGQAYGYANAAHPNCTDQSHNCMRIAGDTNLRFGGSYPKVARSRCGSISGTLSAVTSRTATRAHHIRCSSSVPSGSTLTIGASPSYPYNEVAFLNSSKLTATGSLNVATGSGIEISLVSAMDRNKGMKIKPSGELKAFNGGKIRVYE